MRIIQLPPREGGGRKDSIDPSALFVETNSGTRIVVDFGSGQDRFWDGESSVMEERPLIPKYPPHPPHFIILTHAHIDHVGSVPLLCQKFPNARIVTTRPTLEICRVQWIDSKKIARINGYPGLAPFSNDLYRRLKKEALIVDEPGWVHLRDDVSVCFIPNGHIRGSASVFIKADGKVVGFSGDVSVYDSPLVKGMRQEDFRYLQGRRPDVFFIESTYGNRNISSRDSELKRGLAAIRDTIARGGKVIESAFALGRAQEVLIEQASRMRVGQVFLDSPMASELWHLFADKSRSFWSDHDVAIPESLLVEDSKERRIVHVAEVAGSKPDFRRRIISDPGPRVVVATAGCFQAGRSAEFAKAMIGDPNNLCVLWNHQFEGTPGATLEEIEQNGIIFFGDDEPVRVRSEVVRVENSAHAGADQLLSIARWANARVTYTYHGTPAGQSSLWRLMKQAGLRVGGANFHRGEWILV